MLFLSCYRELLDLFYWIYPLSYLSKSFTYTSGKTTTMADSNHFSREYLSCQSMSKKDPLSKDADF